MKKKSFRASFGVALRNLLLLVGIAFLLQGAFSSRAQASENTYRATSEYVNSIQEGLAENHDSWLVKIESLIFGKVKEFLGEQEKVTGYRDVVNTYCITNITNRFDELGAVLAGLARDFATLILNSILQIIEDVLNAMCDLTTTIIENALNMVCLPLPTLSLGSLSLPSLDANSCDGVSLADFVTVERAAPVRFKRYGVPSHYMNAPLMRAYPSSGATGYSGGSIKWFGAD